MNESNQLDKTASRELTVLAARVAVLEKVVAALTTEPIDFSNIPGAKVVLPPTRK